MPSEAPRSAAWLMDSASLDNEWQGCIAGNSHKPTDLQQGIGTEAARNTVHEPRNRRHKTTAKRWYRTGRKVVRPPDPPPLSEKHGNFHFAARATSSLCLDMPRSLPLLPTRFQVTIPSAIWLGA
jgi:hypothetical protein